jgi:hypothetical protein
MATKKRHSPEQIVRKLTAADRLLAEGKDTAAVCASWGSRRRRITAGVTSSVDERPRTPSGSRISNARTPRLSGCWPRRS